GDLRARLDQLRREAGVALLRGDPLLDQLAHAVAQGLVEARGGKLAGAAGPVDRALARLSPAYRWVRTVSTAAVEIAQLRNAPDLVDGSATHAGVAAVAGLGADGKETIYVVVLLA